ncbi:hypothetical protein PanWU01x14_191690 [Parasponia andersonii]|uniref:Uncharacterized protein n=1 Tax=Parasponia andersonii TaxID=3476 RepID=A0A2P5C1H8_PARAD|nr:hypothetical protein PanWU01x14_191690 [Parasponia andersonii]
MVKIPRRVSLSVSRNDAASPFSSHLAVSLFCSAFEGLNFWLWWEEVDSRGIFAIPSVGSGSSLSKVGD